MSGRKLYYILLFVICGIHQRVNLEFVSFSNPNLQSVPFDLITENVTTLVIRYNRISTIDSFVFYQILHSVLLSFSELTVFQNLTAIGDTLINLGVTNNKLQTIPSAQLDDLSQLQVLNLTNNSLCSFPDASGPASSLLWLLLNMNNFKTIPVLKHIGKRLTKFELNNNKIEHINLDALPS